MNVSFLFQEMELKKLLKIIEPHSKTLLDYYLML